MMDWFIDFRKGKMHNGTRFTVRQSKVICFRYSPNRFSRINGLSPRIRCQRLGIIPCKIQRPTSADPNPTQMIVECCTADGLNVVQTARMDKGPGGITATFFKNMQELVCRASVEIALQPEMKIAGILMY
jgi:hypothetical protein